MLVRSLGGIGTILLVTMALVAHQAGWVEGAVLGRAVAVLSLVVGLIGVLRLPWDVVFEARNVLARQTASLRRGLEVDPAEVAFAKASARRALLLAVALHLLGAGLAFVARGRVGDEVGLLLAVAFVASMALRPIHAFVVHTRTRLSVASREAVTPREDAVTLRLAIEAIEARMHELDGAQRRHEDSSQTRLTALEARLLEDTRALRTSLTATDGKLDRVLREFERTVEKTQESAEVLAGIRAFVRLVREA